jgi:dihydroneopterin aldolase
VKITRIIHLRQLEFYAYHGVLKEEQDLGQRFLVDVDLYPSEGLYNSDHIDETLNYAEVFEVVKNCVLQERYQLIETLAERIATLLLSQFSCSKVRVEVYKPQAPIPGVYGNVSAEVILER